MHERREKRFLLSVLSSQHVLVFAEAGRFAGCFAAVRRSTSRHPPTRVLCCALPWGSVNQYHRIVLTPWASWHRRRSTP